MVMSAVFTWDAQLKRWHYHRHKRHSHCKLGKKILGEMKPGSESDATLKDDDPDPFCVESLAAKFVHC